MAYNGSGTFLINTAGQPVVSGTVISSTAFNALTADLATGLSTAITKDGQTTVTANIPMSTYKFTGLGVGSAATDSANLSQVQSTVTKLLNSVSGADTITATASPTLAAYAAGQMFYFVAAGDNTTSVTLNIDSLGAKAVTRDGATALAAADIKSGEVVVVVYDGTRFQVVSQLNSAGDARFANVSIASSLYVGGVSTFVGNAGFSANVSIASALSVGGVAAITGATTIGGNLTLSAGTASGVVYLNGSKVATSGSALYFNGTQFGVGTNSINAANTAEVTGDIANTWSVGATRFVGSRFSDGAGYELGIKTVMDTRETRLFAKAADTGGFVTIATGTTPSERLRVDGSGNLGIGTASPVYKLDVNGNAQVGNATAATNRFLYINGVANKAGAVAFQESGVNRWLIGNGAASENGNFEIYDATNGNNFILTRTGNLGLGVTPSAVSSGDKVVQVGAFLFNNNSNGYGILRYNNFYNGTNDVYYANGAASAFQMAGNAFRWYQAPSGTAGNTISFTQAMTLTAAGDLGVGTTSPGARLSVTNSNSTSPTIEMGGNQVREFVRTGTQSSDTTIRVDISFASQTTNWISHIVEITVATSVGSSSARYGGVVRYAVSSLDTASALQGPTALGSDLTGITATTAISGNDLRVTLTSTGNIDLYCVYVRIVSSATNGPATGVVIS